VSTYANVIGRPRPVNLLPAQGKLADYQAVLDQAVSERQNNERLPRWIVLAMLIVLAAGLISRFPARSLAWTFGGALVSGLLVHLRIRVLDGHAYSLGWVTGQMDLILYIAQTTLIGMAVGWLVMMFGLNGFRQGRLNAALKSIGLTLAVVVLLALPVGWSAAYNGPVTTWTLPDATSYFLGFLVLVQICVSAAGGLLLTGLGALLSRGTSG
jgi:hypothetical protein